MQQLFCFQKLLLVDDETIAIDKTFDGDTEESVVVDVLGAGTGGGGAKRTATGESKSNDGGSSNDEKLFHNFIFLSFCVIPPWNYSSKYNSSFFWKYKFFLLYFSKNMKIICRYPTKDLWFMKILYSVISRKAAGKVRMFFPHILPRCIPVRSGELFRPGLPPHYLLPKIS